jgi:hypothetical protein
MSSLPTSEQEFQKFLVSEYLKHGSIDKVFKLHNYNLPISFASYHRLLNKFQIVKSAGPNSKLSESLHILSLLNAYKLPLERIYHKYSPHTLQVSTNTLHRVLHNIRLGVTSRVGVALLISSSVEPNKYLLGQDNSLTNPQLGQKGDWSLPMGYTREQDGHCTGIKRVLQQEVFTQYTVNNKFPKNLFPEDQKEIFTINISDIKVYVYRLILDKSYSFSSFKLENFGFYGSSEIEKLKTRGGVADILKTYTNLRQNTNFISDFNQSLCPLPLQVKIR